MKTSTQTVFFFLLAVIMFALVSCGNPFKDDYKDNSPTSGRLKVYYDEGLRSHLTNQVYTFESLYPKAKVELRESDEHTAVQALLNDSCEAIVISRKLTEQESRAFASRQYTPGFSAIAISAVALIANAGTALEVMETPALKDLLLKDAAIPDSTGSAQRYTVLFDHDNSSVLHYVTDTFLGNRKLSGNCRMLNSTLESIRYVAANKDAVALIDFAWLSDQDDTLWKGLSGKIKFVALGTKGKFEYPSQTSLKLGAYPLLRTVFYYRKTGEFTLAKGFESFMAGPKGQMTFLKQGLMPTRQWERNIEVNMERP